MTTTAAGSGSRPLHLSRGVRFVLVGAAILGLLIGLDTLILHLQLDPLADVHAYYDAGTRLNAGLPLYDQPAGIDDPAFYRYPPLLAVLFRPLALVPFEAAALIWEGVLLAAAALTVVRLGVRRPLTWLLMGWLAAPIAWSLAVGQAQVLVTWLLVIGSPWAVAFAGDLKLFPALVVIVWVGRRDLRSLGRFVAWVAILALVCLVLEPSGTIAFIGFSDLSQVGAIDNKSLYAISPVLWAGSVIVLAAVALRLAPTRFGWAAAIVLSVFVTPRLFMYQLSTLLAAARREPAEPAVPAVPAD